MDGDDRWDGWMSRRVGAALCRSSTGLLQFPHSYTIMLVNFHFLSHTCLILLWKYAMSWCACTRECSMTYQRGLWRVQVPASRRTRWTPWQTLVCASCTVASVPICNRRISMLVLFPTFASIITLMRIQSALLQHSFAEHSLLRERNTSVQGGLTVITLMKTNILLILFYFEKWRLQDKIIECFKILKGFMNVDASKLFSNDNTSRTRNNGIKLRRKQIQLDCTKFFFTSDVVRECNNFHLR